MSTSDAQERPALATPSTPSPILILEQSAHCDWDWLTTFNDYYTNGYPRYGDNPVQTVLNNAISIFNGNPGYIYAFCEMAYLQKFLQANPQSLPSGFNISSGGITSPDNLLTHGEAFIRNFLIGRQWIALANLNIAPSNYLWVPDDFGHDAQLPIVLQAMGFLGAGFWRIPAAQSGIPDTPPAAANSPSSRLLDPTTGSMDFVWQAADGSSIQGHWLAYSYCQGNNALGSTGLAWGQDGIAQASITLLVQQSLYNLTPPQSSSPPRLRQVTPYLFVPVDCDFSLPYTNLLSIVTEWNNCNSGSGQNCNPVTNPPYTKGVSVVLSTFADFMDRVYAYNQQNNALPIYSADQNSQAWVPNPFYSGCYASQPSLKRLHYSTTRMLLFAEAMELILEYLAQAQGGIWTQTAAASRQSIASAWADLMPSTHHDYITGTAGVPSERGVQPTSNPVYSNEQLPDLQNAHKEANAALAEVLKALASTIKPPQSEGAVAVFNAIAFSRADIAEMEVVAGSTKFQSSTMDGTTFTPIQYVNQGTKLLLMAQAPSMGYGCLNLSATAPTTKSLLSLTQNGNQYTLSNQLLSATISIDSATGGIGISSLFDNGTQLELLSGLGNQVVFYVDLGNIYRFGNELYDIGENGFYADSSVQLQNAAFAAVEQGPLMVALTVNATVTVGSATIPYTIRYSLLVAEPFLRIEVTGTAPSGYSVMVRFPFASATQPPIANDPVASLCYGTPYHWDIRQPRNYFDWTPPANVEQICFEATHNFILPLDANNRMLAAIYHASTPAWAIDSSKALLGCILRNAPGAQNGAMAADNSQHKVVYAIGVPSILPAPQSACGFQSVWGGALRFNNPMPAVLLPANNQNGVLQKTISIAATQADTSLITAAKVGTMSPTDMVLRVYQPTNESLSNVRVELDPLIAPMYQSNGELNVVPQTALETTPQEPPNIGLTASTTSFTFNAPFALTTFALQRLANK